MSQIKPLYTYFIPDTTVWDTLRGEADLFLKPLGFVASDQAGTKLHVSLELAERGDEEALLRRVQAGRRIELHVQAGNAAAAAHGFHRALELLGFGYSFFANSAPERPVLSWPHAGDEVRMYPDFPVRGLLGWHNFLNSPTVWNLDDYENYLLTLWRWGGNTALFHQYDVEPLTAMRDPKGKWTAGSPFSTTLDAPWGGIKGIAVDDFAHGTGCQFKDAVKGRWGAASCFAKDPIQVAQDTFAKACEFAKSLGVRMMLGFELIGNPASSSARSVVKRRIENVLKSYPSLHTLCLWQAEGRGQRGWPEFEQAPESASLLRKHARHFGNLAGSPPMLAEGCRLAEWLLFAEDVVRRANPQVQLALAGWGGDRWMRWGDFWKGLDAIAPEHVTFAQLDNINPLAEDTVSRAAISVKSDRALWSIPWIESDAGTSGRASMWHPQDDAARMLLLARSARRLGYRGLLGIHWQTAGVESNAFALIRGGWDSAEKSQVLHLQRAAAFFSATPGVARKVAAILEELEALGAGWTGTSQQTECGNFSWDSFVPVTTAQEMPKPLVAIWRKMESARSELFRIPLGGFAVNCVYDALLLHFRQCQTRPDMIRDLERLRLRFSALRLETPHARRLLATMDFVLAYESIRRELVSKGPLRNVHNLIVEARNAGIKPEAELIRAGQDGLRRIDATWSEVFDAQTRRLDTRGDLGNLANLNLKAWQDWKKFRAELLAITS